MSLPSIPRRLLLVDHCLIRAGGHSLTAAEAVLEGDPLAGVRANVGCTVSHPRIERTFTHSDMHPSVKFPGMPPVGMFARLAFRVRVAFRLLRANVLFAHGLGASPKPTLWFAVNGSIRNALALLWRCWRSPNDAAVCYILQDPGRSFRMVERIRKLMGLGNFHLAAETRALAANVEAVSGGACQVLEFPVPIHHAISPSLRRGSQSVPVGGFLGMPRREKGFDILVQAALILSKELSESRLGLKLQAPPSYLQHEEYKEEIMILHNLVADQPNVIVVDRELDGPAYQNLLAECDFIIVPYRLVAYARRSSLVPIEALLHGKPLVVTRGLMVLDALPENAGIVLAEDGDSESLAGAIREMVNNLESYRSQSESIAPEWKDRYSPEKFAAAIHGIVGSPL